MEIKAGCPKAWTSTTSALTDIANHCDDNPNDQKRIKLTKNEADIKKMFYDGFKEYQKVMHKYIKDIGGGFGTAAHYANWNDWTKRDPLSIHNDKFMGT